MLWLIIGGGVSGLGAAKLLRMRGESVRVSDGKTLPPHLRQGFEALGVAVLDGGHHLAHLDQIDRLVVSPGVRPDHLLMVAARERKIPYLTEIDLALEDFSHPVVAVTGTNGKSTTCVMIGHMLAETGHAHAVGGNLGDPPCAIVAEGRAKDPLILELSSYQLELSEKIQPKVGLFTSFSHDHIQRHGSIEEYFKAKWRAFKLFRPSSLALMPAYIRDQAEEFGLSLPRGKLRAVHQPQQGDGKVSRRVDLEDLVFADAQTLIDRTGNVVVDLSPSLLQEPHNLLNGALAALCCQALTGKAPQVFAQTLSHFGGLPHRCELVGHIDGHPIINDSKSTNVESTLVALKAQNQPVILLMGGQGKDEPYQPILQEKSRIHRLITFGATGKKIENDLAGALDSRNFSTLALALKHLTQDLVTKPHAVLFSPGCASFDEFANFEERGRFFVDAFRPLLNVRR